MMRLPLHIEYLLTRHDCVIVPGIGAFIATEKESAVCRTQGIVTPRRREISFNGSVVTDDGLLAHSIARRERLSYEEAHRLLEGLTSGMRRELEVEGETSVGRVGKLTLSADGTLGFLPRRSIADIDILSEVPLAAVKQDDAESAVGSRNESITLGSDKSTSPRRRSRILTEDRDRYVFSVSKRFVHAAAAVALILTVCLSILIPYNHDEEQRASVVPIEDFLLRPLVIEVQDDASEASEEVPSDSIIHTTEIKNQ